MTAGVDGSGGERCRSAALITSSKKKKQEHKHERGGSDVTNWQEVSILAQMCLIGEFSPLREENMSVCE